jgi:hypothetical protein
VAVTNPVIAHLQQVATQKAQQYGVPVGLFLRQIGQESGWNPNARSGAGALGIAQFIPSTAKAYGLSNPFDPVAALDAAARYDATLLKQYGSPARMLSAYNSGRPDAYQDPNFAGGQTYHYVRSILGGTTPSVPSPSTPQTPSPVPGVALTAPIRRPSAAGNTLAILNEGARMFGLPPLPAVTSSAPSRLPMTAGSAAAPPLAQTRPTQTAPPKVTGPTLPWLEHQAAPFGLTVTSTTGGQHATHSYHYQGRAVDLGGPPARMAAAANYALAHPGLFTEMFYTGPGHPNYFISGGKVLPHVAARPDLYLEHENHVHWAR